MARVCFFDCASRLTGVAYGDAGSVPQALVWDHGADASRGRRLGRLITEASRFLKDYQPEAVGIEAPANLQFAAQKSTQAVLALVGAAMVVEAVCDLRGVHNVRLVDVQKVRAHFVNQRTFRKSFDPVDRRVITSREMAKSAVLNMCRMRGWSPKSDDEGDAMAGWSWTCAQLDPRLGALATPLLRSLR